MAAGTRRGVTDASQGGTALIKGEPERYTRSLRRAFSLISMGPGARRASEATFGPRSILLT